MLYLDRFTETMANVLLLGYKESPISLYYDDLENI